MDIQLQKELQENNIDIQGSIQRFAGNADLYEKFLRQFPSDENFAKLSAALSTEDWESVFQASHTLKGVSGNLGLTRLYQACSEMVRLLREPDYAAVKESYPELKSAYEEICALLRRFEED